MNDFMIIKNMKLFIFNLDNIIVNIPNRDKLLKNRLYDTSYDVLYLIYRCNCNSDNRNEYYKDILSNISMLDFYLERCLKNRYISDKVCNKLCKDLLRITKMLYGWIKSESKC